MKKICNGDVVLDRILMVRMELFFYHIITYVSLISRRQSED